MDLDFELVDGFLLPFPDPVALHPDEARAGPRCLKRPDTCYRRSDDSFLHVCGLRLFANEIKMVAVKSVKIPPVPGTSSDLKLDRDVISRPEFDLVAIGSYIQCDCSRYGAGCLTFCGASPKNNCWDEGEDNENVTNASVLHVETSRRRRAFLPRLSMRTTSKGERLPY